MLYQKALQNRYFARLLPYRKNKILESRRFGILRFYFCSGVEYKQNTWFFKAFYQLIIQSIFILTEK